MKEMWNPFSGLYAAAEHERMARDGGAVPGGGPAPVRRGAPPRARGARRVLGRGGAGRALVQTVGPRPRRLQLSLHQMVRSKPNK